MATAILRQSIKVKKHEVLVFCIFETVSKIEPLTYNEYKEHLQALNAISPFMNFFQTGLQRVKRDPIMSNGKNIKSKKLHLDLYHLNN